MLANSEHYI